MQQFLDQAKHNLDFLNNLEVNFSDDFFDWKVTVAFYVVTHYFKYYLKEFYQIDIDSHKELRNTIKNPPKTIVNVECFESYLAIYNTCHTLRYDGLKDGKVKHMALCKSEYLFVREDMDYIVKYLEGMIMKKKMVL